MELKDFVAATLCEIQEGVQKAINDTQENDINGVINPCWGGSHRINRDMIEKVNFDIAVTIDDQATSGIKGGIKVVGISLGGEDGETSRTSKVSRIQFSIPVIPPVTTVNG